jgi:hypothetical protein
MAERAALIGGAQVGMSIEHDDRCRRFKASGRDRRRDRMFTAQRNEQASS